MAAYVVTFMCLAFGLLTGLKGATYVQILVFVLLILARLGLKKNLRMTTAFFPWTRIETMILIGLVLGFVINPNDEIVHFLKNEIFSRQIK